MSENDVQVKVEEDTPVYVATAEPVEGEAQPVEQDQGGFDRAAEAVEPLKNVSNPMDAMDGWTLLVALLVTTVIVFIAACVDLGQSNFGGAANGVSWWAFAGSLIGLIVVIVLMILKKCAEETSVKIGPFAMIFLLVLWVCIVFPCTFQPPFQDLSNGWIGSWASLAVAGALAARAFADKAKAMTNAMNAQTGNAATKFALFLGMGSIVVLIAACFAFGNTLSCAGGSGLAGYAVSVAVISIVAVVIILVIANVESCKAHSGKTNMIISIILIVWWAVGAFVLTFVGPFQGSGCSMNGYVATWLSLFCALSLFKACGLDTVTQLFNKNKAKTDGGDQEAADETPAL